MAKPLASNQMTGDRYSYSAPMKSLACMASVWATIALNPITSPIWTIATAINALVYLKREV